MIGVSIGLVTMGATGRLLFTQSVDVLIAIRRETTQGLIRDIHAFAFEFSYGLAHRVHVVQDHQVCHQVIEADHFLLSEP